MIALPTGDVLDTLAQLQADVKAAPRDKPAQSLHEIRRTLLRRTREKHGENAMLSPQDQDTFDLLDLLYGEIRREVRPEAPAADLLARYGADPEIGGTVRHALARLDAERASHLSDPAP